MAFCRKHWNWPKITYMGMYVLAGSQVCSRKICDTQNQIGIFLRGLKKQKIDRKFIFFINYWILIEEIKYWLISIEKKLDHILLKKYWLKKNSTCNIDVLLIEKKFKGKLLIDYWLIQNFGYCPRLSPGSGKSSLFGYLPNWLKCPDLRVILKFWAALAF